MFYLWSSIIFSWTRTSLLAKCTACHTLDIKTKYAISPKKSPQANRQAVAEQAVAEHHAQHPLARRLASAEHHAQHPLARRLASAEHHAQHPLARRLAVAKHHARHPHAKLLVRSKLRVHKPLSVVNSNSKYYRTNRLKIVRDGKIRRHSVPQLPYTRPLLRLLNKRRRVSTQIEYVYNLNEIDYATTSRGMYPFTVSSLI